jgi:hypothetical protein
MSYEVQNPLIRRGAEGPQLVLTWDSPVERIVASQENCDSTYQWGHQTYCQRLAQFYALLVPSISVNLVGVKLSVPAPVSDSVRLAIYSAVGGVPSTLLAYSTNVINGVDIPPEDPVPANVPTTFFEFAPLNITTDFAIVVERTGPVPGPMILSGVETVTSGGLMLADVGGSWLAITNKNMFFEVYIVMDFAVRRGVLDFPDETSGDLVYSGTDLHFIDLNVVPFVTYYYTIFSIIGGTWYWSTKTQVYEFAMDNSNTPLELYKLLPRIYRSEDLKGTLVPLEYAEGEDGEQFNFNEDHNVGLGQLRRFLKLFGLEFGDIRGLIEYFSYFYDVLNVRLDFLGLLANFIGLTLIPFETQQRSRFLILNAIYLYKIRGTLQGLSLFAGNIVGEIPLIKEFSNNIIYMNEVDSTHFEGADPPGTGFDPATIAKIGKYIDQSDYMLDFSMGAMYSPRSIGFFFTSIDPMPHIDLILAYFSDFIPATVNWFLFYNDVQVYPVP